MDRRLISFISFAVYWSAATFVPSVFPLLMLPRALSLQIYIILATRSLTLRGLCFQTEACFRRTAQLWPLFFPAAAYL